MGGGWCDILLLAISSYNGRWLGTRSGGGLRALSGRLREFMAFLNAILREIMGFKMELVLLTERVDR